MFYYTLPEHLSSSSVIKLVFFTRSLVLWIVVFLLSLFGRCVVCPSSIYGFWLSLWNLQTLLIACAISIMNWLTAMTIWPRICFAYRNRNPLQHFSSMTLHRTVNKCNTTDVTSGPGTAISSEVPEIDFSVLVRLVSFNLKLVFCVVFCV